MKIAYLIVAHQHYNHLNRLLNSLNEPDAHFYIHIDAKAKMPVLEERFKVHFIERKKVYWGGFSQVNVTLKLMEAAVKDQCDYYALLSGVDYPVRPISNLKQLLQQGGEFINIEDGPTNTKPITRFDRPYFEFKNRRANGFFNKLGRAVEKIWQGMVKQDIPFKLYVGSNWFVLSHTAVKYVLQTTHDDHRFIKLFKRSLCPDEAFFQTILGNSPFKEQCRHNLTYADWDDPNPPAIICAKHIEVLKGKVSDAYGSFESFFARKFNDDSGEITAEIDREMLNDTV